MKRGFLNRQPREKTGSLGAVHSAQPAPRLRPFESKPPIGKIDSTLLDGLDDEIALSRRRFDALAAKHPEYAYYHKTIPTPPAGQTLVGVPDGCAECLFTACNKDTITSVPNSLSAVEKPPFVRHRIRPSSHGSGVFATRSLKMGDLILAERPLLVIPVAPATPVAFLENSTVTKLQMTLAGMVEYEKVLQVCVDRMSPENREAFFALYNCHTEDGSGPISGRVRTNGIGLGNKAQVDDSAISTGVYKDLSRINHSCTPNAAYSFDYGSFSCQVRATREIKKGEEIFIAYDEIAVPTAQRQANLKPYGFECTCTVCSDPTSDALLALIKQSTAHKPAMYDFGLSPAVHRANLQNSLEWMAKIDAMGWQQLSQYSSHISTAVAASSALGRRADMVKYKVMCDAWLKAVANVELSV